MLYQFKQAVHLNGKNYPCGVHEVDEKTEYHSYFLKLVSAGLVLEADVKKAVSPVDLQERSKKLLEKLMAKKPVVEVPEMPDRSKTPPIPLSETALKAESENAEGKDEKKKKKG